MRRQAGVAAGNADTVRTAVEVLRAGGTAVDAVVAAGFAAAVSEPTLTGLGGGGFLLVDRPGNEPVVLDFFVSSPGQGAEVEPHMVPVTLHFEDADQEFHVGWGSVAVPGCLDGYIAAHARWGRLPLSDVVAPARRLGLEGSVLDGIQAGLLVLLREVLTLSAEGRELYGPGGNLLQQGEIQRNEAYAALLSSVAAGEVRSLASDALVEAAAAGGGVLTRADLASYAVVERAPLRFTHAAGEVLTNPPPSVGGSRVLAALQRVSGGGTAADWAQSLTSALVHASGVPAPAPQVRRGTTHISVVDAEGTAAAMTTSLGSCSGVFVPGTGVQLNNMMGELDLHPDGLHALAPGTRIGSMTAPTVVRAPDGTVTALGTGGSERIRSTMTCVLSRLLDRGSELEQAVRAPRVHWDGERLQVEPGLPEEPLRAYAVNRWSRPDLYFGGVHAVRRSPDGTVTAVGDDRRGGVAAVIDL
ncbi:gamma-glutamyltransferase [Motilibacter rhizosphaerae]|uniref:Gamma-glutamyltransferase n=1 Tax=Motilibacter rhizosphaerae TaxID=598652 RepID=A0A4Q7NQL2_9ACTN|nr:gamma-glutamyltransferase [Motilibacter rhizosphaerae]RZS86880.1 gamma-glutamyltransferase [Motilibacter rhizosphaerae]